MSLAILSFLLYAISYTKVILNKSKAKNEQIEFVYRSIAKNHPAMYDRANPTFPVELRRRYKLAKKALEKLETRKQKVQDNLELKEKSFQLKREFLLIIKNFVESFGDPHLAMYLPLQRQDKVPEEKRAPTNRPFGFEYLGKDILWIKLPSLRELNLHEEQAFKKILEEAKKARRLKAIVFDLRGNRGGNSLYGRQLLRVIDPNAEAKRQLEYRKTFVDWRASAGNLEQVIKDKNNALVRLKSINNNIVQERQIFNYVQRMQRLDLGFCIRF